MDFPIWFNVEMDMMMTDRTFKTQLNAVFPGFKQGISLAALVVISATVLTGCSVSQKVDSKSDNSVVAKLSEKPVLDEQANMDDFEFPAEAPSLAQGKKIYEKNCMSCHAVSYWQTSKVQQELAHTTPIDMYLMLSSGKRPKTHLETAERQSVLPMIHGDESNPLMFQEKLTRDERWAVLFFVRYLAGDGDFSYKNTVGKDLNVASVFGANCAVCHGKRGFADGPLHSGHPSSHELAAGKVHGGLFQPPPANFHDYKRMYNRTDMQLVKYIKEGLYPSGMPPWYGLKDKDNKFVFDNLMIWRLVKHVRQFAYTNDLEDAFNQPDYKVDPKNALAPYISKDDTGAYVLNAPKSNYPSPMGQPAQQVSPPAPQAQTSPSEPADKE